MFLVTAARVLDRPSDRGGTLVCVPYKPVYADDYVDSWVYELNGESDDITSCVSLGPQLIGPTTTASVDEKDKHLIERACRRDALIEGLRVRGLVFALIALPLIWAALVWFFFIAERSL